jgi:hypothetical protein
MAITESNYRCTRCLTDPARWHLVYLARPLSHYLCDSCLSVRNTAIRLYILERLPIFLGYDTCLISQGE